MKTFANTSGLMLSALMLITTVLSCQKEKLSTPDTSSQAEAAITSNNSAVVSTYAGHAQGYLNGPKEDAMFNLIVQLVEGPDGVLYVADYNVIRKVSKDGNVSTLAGCYTSTTSQDGKGERASFTHLTGLAITPWGVLYAFEYPTYTNLRQIDANGLVISVFVNDEPSSLTLGDGTLSFGALDSSLYMISYNFAYSISEIYKVHPVYERLPYQETPNFIYGELQLQNQSFISSPPYTSIEVDKEGALYLMTTGNEVYKRTVRNIIKSYSPPKNTLVKMAARSAAAKAVKPDTTSIYRDAFAIAADGTVYFTDGLVIRILHTDGTVSVLAGSTPGYADGPAAEAKFENIMSLELAENDKVLYVAENYRIRKISGLGQ